MSAELMSNVTLSNSVVERSLGDNTWLRFASPYSVPVVEPGPLNYTVLETEDEVGLALYTELRSFAEENPGDINVVLLGGRGAQAMYRHIHRLAAAGEIDDLLGRLNVFTQDALAPMRMDNSLSFVNDFRRLLGEPFFSRVKSFTPMRTDTGDLKGALETYIEKINSLGGIDLFFLGLGPEAEAASHLCYIKPNCGIELEDYAGMIAISPTILEHHISKFKIGGSEVSTVDESECRGASHILTFGPAAILTAKRLIQSIVDASTAPGKRESFSRLNNTVFDTERSAIAAQVDQNPGLLIRLHPDVRSYVLPDLID